MSFGLGAVRFEGVTKEYTIGRPRVFLAAAWPFGDGLARRERLRALDDVTIDIGPGDAFALIGANGAGKSTALKCLARITEPTRGAISANGRVVALIELGVSFHPDLTGLENARFAAIIAGLRGRAARHVVEDAIEFSEIERFIDTPVKRYSSGMYARLSFGIAQALPSDILLVDEILAVGDLAFQRKCYERIGEFRRDQGRTLVFVSHNEWVLKETCRNAALLSHGRVVASGPVGEVLNRYHAEVEPTPDRFMAGESQLIRIERVVILPDDRRVVKLHEPLTLEFDVLVLDEVDAPVAAVAIFDSDGRLVWGCYSDETSVALAAGRHTVKITIQDVNLLPGPIRLQVFVFDRASPVSEDIRRLDILVDGSVSNLFENGLVHIPTVWSVEPVTQAPAREEVS
jgi:ABC-type polysaccharide/polyol phosphate transport system ATPase subunit